MPDAIALPAPDTDVPFSPGRLKRPRHCPDLRLRKPHRNDGHRTAQQGWKFLRPQAPADVSMAPNRARPPVKDAHAMLQRPVPEPSLPNVMASYHRMPPAILPRVKAPSGESIQRARCKATQRGRGHADFNFRHRRRQPAAAPDLCLRSRSQSAPLVPKGTNGSIERPSIQSRDHPLSTKRIAFGLFPRPTAPRRDALRIHPRPGSNPMRAPFITQLVRQPDRPSTGWSR